MAKTRSIPENTWYQWYKFLISPIPESMKKLESNLKQKFMKLLDTPMGYKPKKTKGAFEGRYADGLRRMRKIKKIINKIILWKFRPTYWYDRQS